MSDSNRVQYKVVIARVLFDNWTEPPVLENYNTQLQIFFIPIKLTLVYFIFCQLQE